MEELGHYLRVIFAKDAALIFLCICGAILNGAMLYVLSTKKQIRASVYTAYMIQIALTDLLVCVVWLVLTCVLTSELIRQSQASLSTDYVPNETEGDIINGSIPSYASVFKPDKDGKGSQYEIDSGSQFTIWRVLYTVYNFHYYTNIFLLASMSVERCAAVWKSLRCQRYQYNRKSIYSVSIAVWIVSLACVLPSFIDPNLVISESDTGHALQWTLAPTPAPYTIQAEKWDKLENPLEHIFEDPANGIVSKNVNITSLSNDFETKKGITDLPKSSQQYDSEEDVLYRTDMEILYECYLLLWRARQQNRECVTDYKEISLTECLHIVDVITAQYSDQVDYSETYDENYNYEDEAVYTDDESYNWHSNSYYDDDVMLPVDPAAGLEDNENSNWPIDGGLPPVMRVVNETAGTFCITTDFYHHLLVEAAGVLVKHYKGKKAADGACDPFLTDAARIYVISVNLIIGFFIPFVVIVISYVSIAYMIGKRASSRMKPDNSEGGHHHYNYAYNSSQTLKPNQTDTIGRRMTHFLRYMMAASFGSEDKSYWDESAGENRSMNSSKGNLSPTSPTSGSKRKIFLKNMKEQRAVEMETRASNAPCFSQTQNINETSLKVPSNQRIKKFSFGHDAATDHIPQTIAEHPHESDESASFENSFVTPPRTTNNTKFQNLGDKNLSQIRRESGGSYTSSVESFPTEQTSVTDKRLSGTTVSALTPPTPLHHSHSPNVNEFFPLWNEHNDGNKPDNVNNSHCMEKHSPNEEEQNLLEQKLNRPKVNRYYSAPAETQSCESDDFKQQKETSPLNKKSGVNEFAYKIFKKSLMKKKQEQEVDESTLDENSIRDRSAHKSPLSSSRVPENTRSNMKRSFSAPERQNNRINGSGSRMSSLKRYYTSEHNQLNHPHKYHRQTSTQSIANFFRGRTNSNTSSRSGNTMRKTVVRKNAERHLRVSRTVLAYVIVFALCWLPQRIVYLLYVIEGLMEQSSGTCLKLISVTRVISFITVLLNPIVYVVTQRELRSYMGQKFRKSQFMKLCCGIGKRFKRKPAPKETADGISSARVPPTWSGNQNNRGEEGVIPPGTTDDAKPLMANNNSSNNVGILPQINVHHTNEKLTNEELLKTPMLKKLEMSEELKKQDAENKNWIELVDRENHISSNSTSKNSNSSSGKEDFFFSKSENIEEFWMRWLQEKQYDAVNQQANEDTNSSAATKVLAKMSEDMNETAI